MPKRSKCSLLPPELREELDKKLIETNFSDFQGLETWLEQQGFEISHTSIWRYSQKFAEQIATLKQTSEQAKAIVEVLDDGSCDLGDALTRLAQHKAFETLLELKNDPKALGTLGAMISSLNKTSIVLAKYQAEVREKAKALADEIASSGKRKGLSEETAAEIRAKILGLVQ